MNTYIPLTQAAIVLEEIVVTARKREESVQDIPVAVTSVTGDMFDRAAITNFEEATALTPGFNMTAASFSPLSPNLSMRGSAQNSVTPTDDPSVGIYVDGVYIARPYGVGVDLLDISNVQALKGPQGTLFGRNSTAGALLLNTNNPDLGEFSGSVSATLGDELTFGSIILNIPMGDMFALRVAHQTSDRDDWVKSAAQDPNNPLYTQFDNANRIYDADCSDGLACAVKTTDTNVGGYDSEITRVKIRFFPTEELDFILSHEKFKREQAGPIRETLWLAGAATNADIDDVVSFGFDPRVYAETETNILTITYDTDFGEFKFIASNREYRALNESDYDGGDLAAPHFFGFSVRRHDSWGRSGGDQDTYELQWVTSFFDEKLDLTSGITYFEEGAAYFDYSNGLDIYQYGFVGGGNGVQIDDSAKGVYMQGTYHINDVSNLTLGFRHSEDDKSAVVWGSSSAVSITQAPSWDFDAYFRPDNYFQRSTGDRSGLVILTPQETFSSTDWLISYDYKLNDDILVYGKVSTGFRAGGFNGRGVNDPTVPFIFEPEELIEFEIGLKGDFMDGRLRSNTAVFMNETDNKQFTALVASSGANPPGTSTKNAGKAEAKGFETELTYLISDSWGLSGSYSYIDTEIVELSGADCTAPVPSAALVDSVPDACIPDSLLVPESEWTLSLNYDQEFDQFKVRGTAMYHWIDEIGFATRTVTDYQTALPAYTIAEVQGAVDAAKSDAYGILNLNITFSTLDDMYNLTFWGKNVLDERAIESNVINIPGGAYQYVTGTVTDQGTYGLSFKVNF